MSGDNESGFFQDKSSPISFTFSPVLCKPLTKSQQKFELEESDELLSDELLSDELNELLSDELLSDDPLAKSELELLLLELELELVSSGQ